MNYLSLRNLRKLLRKLNPNLYQNNEGVSIVALTYPIYQKNGKLAVHRAIGNPKVQYGKAKENLSADLLPI